MIHFERKGCAINIPPITAYVSVGEVIIGLRLGIVMKVRDCNGYGRVRVRVEWGEG